MRYLTEGVAGQSSRWFTTLDAAITAYNHARFSGRVRSLSAYERYAHMYFYQLPDLDGHRIALDVCVVSMNVQASI